MKIYSIDLDGVLQDWGHPIQKNINKVNKLFENPDNFIVIYTARSKEIRKETEELLCRFKVKYHCLKMEKMRADYYMDDRNKKL